jgi:leader peptidase (prepilin peptidase)/N-methyltransferase
MFTVVVVASALVGLAVGSFLNVVIYRVPIGKSIVTPPSFCPECNSPVAPRDNIPVLSWLLLRGKCRQCGAPISARYPIVEALTGVAFAITAVRFGPSSSLPAELIFVAGLIALAAVDLERYLLPRAILYPTLLLVAGALFLTAAITGQWRRLVIAVICGVGSFALFFLINFIRPAWLGFGDVRLAALLGLALGWMGPWYLFIGFMAANLLGAAIGIALIVAKKTRRTTPLPYGVFLAAGSLLALWVGAGIISWYSHQVTH